MLGAFLLLFAGILAGYVLLVLAYILPTAPMLGNVSSSAGIMVSEREYHSVIPGYASTQLDNYTDSWMMGNAVYDSPLPVWKRALVCASADYGAGPLDALVRYAAGEEGDGEIGYARYWHGYLAVLKPFLMICDYADLRAANAVVQTVLVVLVFCSLCGMGYRGEAWGYLVSVIFMVPVVIPLSIQFSVIFYVANISALVLLRSYRFIIDRKLVLLYFQLTGMAASYFDFLTYPAASLGLPLVCLMLVVPDNDFVTRAKYTVSSCVGWCFGYGAMWAGKWVLATAILRDNVIKNALSQVALRSSHVQGGERITVLGTWLRNVEFYLEKPYLAIIAVCAAITIIGVIKNRRQLGDIAADSAIFVAIAVIPFVWYAVMGQHSYEHHWFTFRALMASVFALMCVCARVYRE